MSMTLHLALPGLLGPWFQAPGSPTADFPPKALDRMLVRGRGEVFSGSGSSHLLCRLFGLGGPDRELPIAAATRLAGGLPDQGRHWLRADPVHLMPDQERLRLLDAPHLGLTWPEVRAFIAELNRHFAPDDWLFEAETPECWYLGLPHGVDLLSHPLEDVVGRNLHPFLPAGPGQRHWRGRLNEIQMLLYGTQGNAERESDGRLVVNSLWLWGGGDLPPPPAKPPFARVFADQAVAKGLALWSGGEFAALPSEPEALMERREQGETLVVLEALQRPLLDGDFPAWQQAVSSLESAWIKPLWLALGRWRWQRLWLYPGRGKRWLITPGDSYRFWRRGPGLLAGLAADESEEASG